MRLVAALIAFALPTLARANAYSPDRFEIQVYDVEITPPRQASLELHVNSVVGGGTTVTSPDGELPTHHMLHMTVEPHLGLTRFMEVGAYIQAAVRADGILDYAGLKERVKLRWPTLVKGFGFAINFEISEVPEAYEANRYGSEIRPIVDFRWQRLYASVNPIVGIDLAGALAGHAQFEPAAKVSVRVVDGLALGAEYYGAIGPLDAVAPLDQQSHKLFGVLDANFAVRGLVIDVDAGAGYGFTGDDRWVVKAIVGISGS